MQSVSVAFAGSVAFGFICAVLWFFIAQYFQEHSTKINILHSFIVFVSMSFIGHVIIGVIG